MQVQIKIDTDNDAFQDSEEVELASILKKLSDRFNRGERPTKERDYNGNTVAYIKYVE